MAVTSAAKAPRQSMDFGIIDTTPSHGFKVACIHSTPQIQHFTRDASVLPLLLGSRTQQPRSLTSREIGFDSESCFLGGPRHGSPQ
jgi:hypothetical protein